MNEICYFHSAVVAGKPADISPKRRPPVLNPGEKRVIHSHARDINFVRLFFSDVIMCKVPPGKIFKRHVSESLAKNSAVSESVTRFKPNLKGPGFPTDS